jgi:CheY-like chemotaxis protein
MAARPGPAVPTGTDSSERLPIRVLIVEDDPATARLLEGIAAAAGLTPFATVANAPNALGLAPQADVIILDHQLEGQETGLEVLRQVRRRGLDVGVVVTTGHGSEQVAAEALRAGADDYVVKDANLAAVLPAVLARLLRLREVERALHAAQQHAVRVERRAAIAELTVALSHEMNNPLQALRAELELLRLQADRLPADTRERVAAALAQVDRVADVVRRVALLERDAVTTYVGGTRMTDLRADGASAPG